MTSEASKTWAPRPAVISSRRSMCQYSIDFFGFFYNFRRENDFRLFTFVLGQALIRKKCDLNANLPTILSIFSPTLWRRSSLTQSGENWSEALMRHISRLIRGKFVEDQEINYREADNRWASCRNVFCRSRINFAEGIAVPTINQEDFFPRDIPIKPLTITERKALGPACATYREHLIALLIRKPICLFVNKYESFKY